MAYVRIPTGMKTATATVQSNRFILYRCVDCGQHSIYKMEICGTASTQYHTLQSESTKNSRNMAASQAAANALDKFDAELFYKFNVQRNYEENHEKIQCPRCGKIQPWSNIPCPWHKHPRFFLWSVLFILMPIGFILYLILGLTVDLAAIAVSMGFLLVELLLSIYPFTYHIKRAKLLKQLHTAVFEAPVYYNRTNIQELLTGPYAYLLEEKKSFCRNCGRSLSGRAKFCPHCGMRR